MHDWIPCVLLNDRARLVLFDKVGYRRTLIAVLFEVLLLAFFFRTFTRLFTLFNIGCLSRALVRGVSGFLCLGRLFQGQPNEAALCI